MINSIIDIWIESEEKGSIINGDKYDNDNTDVIVTLDDKCRYIATFFTYKNIENIRNKNKKTGECNSGKYFWASDMIIVEKTDRLTIEETIEFLISSDEFKQVFRKIK